MLSENLLKNLLEFKFLVVHDLDGPVGPADLCGEYMHIASLNSVSVHPNRYIRRDCF